MKPFRYALALSLVYAATAVTYIWLSGVVVAHLAASLDELARMERIKGFAYVGTTALLLFGWSWLLFGQLRRATEEAGQLRRATMMAQSRVLAGELAAAVAHDFNNALMVAQCGIAEALEVGEGPDKAARLREAANAITQGRELALRLAKTARGERYTRPQSCNLAPVAQSLLRALAKLPRLHGKTIEAELRDPAVAQVDVVLFEQILANLVLNAADATSEQGIIRLILTEESTHVRLEVHDNGPGIPPEKRESLFTAFESSKPDGLGLGLLSVRVAVQALEGTLAVDGSSLGGAAFIVHLPTQLPPRQPVQATAAELADAPAHARAW